MVAAIERELLKRDASAWLSGRVTGIAPAAGVTRALWLAKAPTAALIRPGDHRHYRSVLPRAVGELVVGVDRAGPKWRVDLHIDGRRGASWSRRSGHGDLRSRNNGEVSSNR